MGNRRGESWLRVVPLSDALVCAYMIIYMAINGKHPAPIRSLKWSALVNRDALARSSLNPGQRGVTRKGKGGGALVVLPV